MTNGGGGVLTPPKKHDIINEQPLMIIQFYFLFWILAGTQCNSASGYHHEHYPYVHQGFACRKIFMTKFTHHSFQILLSYLSFCQISDEFAKSFLPSCIYILCFFRVIHDLNICGIGHILHIWWGESLTINLKLWTPYFWLCFILLFLIL